jgi:hypothetical protein
MRARRGRRVGAIWGCVGVVLVCCVARAVVGAEKRPRGRMQARDSATSVPLVAEGRAACRVIYPAGDERWRGLAERLATGIASLGGVEVPLIPDAEAVPERFGPLREALASVPLVVIGDLNTNRAVFRLYAGYYTYADAVYPGGEGYVLRTIVRPFGRRANVLLIGGSTFEGVRAGVEACVARLGTLPRDGGGVAWPYGVEAKLGAAIAEEMAPAIRTARAEADAAPEPLLRDARDQFTENAHLYFYTGDAWHAARARACLLRLGEAQPHFFSTDDYKLENLVIAWRRVSHSPVFTDAERQAADQRMYATIRRLEPAWWRRKDASEGIGTRHNTTGMLAWWTAVRVLLECGAPDANARAWLTQWRGEAEAYLDGTLRHYSDDSDDYQSADSAQNLASYALQMGRMQWFTAGLARRAAERIIAVTDNLGWYAGIMGYGEALPGWERFTLDAGMVLGACEYVYGDGTFAWVLARFPALQRCWGALHPWDLHRYAVAKPVAPVEPSWFAGLSVLRFTAYRLGEINAGRMLPDGLCAPGLSAEAAFDKLVYRAGGGADDPYYLLQGTSASELTNIDMNAIVRHTDQGHLWLVHNTGRLGLFDKNAVYVTDGTSREPVAAACALIGHGEADGVALAASRLSGYHGTTWTRHCIFAGDRFAVVIDEVRASRAGQYTAACTWRTPGYAALAGGAWRAQQHDVVFQVVPGATDGLVSRRLAEPDGATRPTVLRQYRSREAAAGEAIRFENVLFTSSPRRVQDVEVRRVAPGAVLIRHRRDGRAVLYLAAAGAEGVRVGALASDAVVLLLSADRAWHVEGTSLTVDGRAVADAPIAGATSVPVDAERVGAFLARLWAGAEAARSAASAPGGETPGAAPHVVWRFADVSERGNIVDGVTFVAGRGVTGSPLLATDRIVPVLPAEPRLSPTRGSGSKLDNALASEASEAAAESAEYANEEPRLVTAERPEFTLDLPAPGRVMGITLYGETFGKTNDPLPPAELELALAFSSDGFASDVRRRAVTVRREPSWHNLYKGHSYVFEQYRVGGLDEPASAVRVQVREATMPVVTVSDVQVYTGEALGLQPTEVRVADVEGDGVDEVLAWRSEGSLCALDADGALRWRQTLPAGILAVDVWDADGDGAREVFVSTTDARVTVFRGDGERMWARSFRTVKEDQGCCTWNGPCIFGMTAWPAAGGGKPPWLFTFYWCAANVTPDDEGIDCFERDGHYTQVRAVPAGLREGGDRVIRSDAPWNGPVPLEWWSASTRKPYAKVMVPNGRIVSLVVDDFDGDGAAEAIVAAEQGVGLYAPGEPTIQWERMTDAPTVGAACVRDEGGGGVDVVYARRDGYVFRVGPDGRVVRSTALGEPIAALTAVRGIADRPVIVVATDSALRILDAETFAEQRRVDGRYQSAHVIRTGEGERLLAVGDDGAVMLLGLE